MSLLRLVKNRQPDFPVVPIATGNFDKLFRLARIEADLKHVRFHDSRREATTTMAPKLSNVLELAAITGHKSLAMLQVYYKPKPADLAARLDAQLGYPALPAREGLAFPAPARSEQRR